MVAFEHAATGAAQVLPAHTACAALWAGHAELVPLDTAGDHPPDLVTHEVVAPEAVAVALERLYHDRRLLLESSARAYAKAHA